MAKHGISEVDRIILDREGHAYVEKWLREADSRIILIEREERTRAMMGKKTTVRYRQLTEGLDLRMPMYLGNNQAESLAAALIFQMRARRNFTPRCQFVRHLRPDDLCPCCGLQEDEGHFIELCPEYAEEGDKLNRQYLQDSLTIGKKSRRRC